MLRKLLAAYIQRIKSISTVSTMLQQILLRLRILIYMGFFFQENIFYFSPSLLLVTPER